MFFPKKTCRDKDCSETPISGHLPVRKNTNVVRQHFKLHMSLFQGILSHNCPQRVGHFFDKIFQGRVKIFFQHKCVTVCIVAYV